MKDKLLFLHIPKNGGTSLSELLSSWFHPDKRCPYRSGLDYAHNFAKGDLDKYDFFTGHVPLSLAQRCIPKELPKLSVLRHPVSRVYSLYAYWRNYRIPKSGILEKPEKGKIPTLYAHELAGPEMAKKHDFGSFLFSNHPYIKRVLTNPQSRYLCSATHESNMDVGDPHVILHDILQNIREQNVLVETLENQEHLAQTLQRLARNYGTSGDIKIPHVNQSEKVFFDGLDEGRIALYLKSIAPIDFMLYESIVKNHLDGEHDTI